MGYTNYLKNANELTDQEFDTVAGFAARAVVEWVQRYRVSMASLDDENEVYDLLADESIGYEETARRLAELWQSEREIFVIFENCESINIRQGATFEFCKTRQLDPEDLLNVAIFWIAHLVNNKVEFSSDGYDWETAEGRAFAERIFKLYMTEDIE